MALILAFCLVLAFGPSVVASVSLTAVKCDSDINCQIRELFAGDPPLLKVEPYQHPQLQVEDGGVVITGDGDRPAGLYFRYQVDPQKKYRLSFAGATVQGEPILRLRYNKEEPIYVTAPQQKEERYLAGVSEVEVLLYADTSFSYQLETIRLEECPACRIDADLQNLLLTEIPGLQDALANNRLLAAHLLLDWTANVTDYAVSREIARPTTQRVDRVSAAQIYYNIFEANKGGVYCAGSAVFFDKVLKIFGYHSFTLNFGDLQNHLTHVTVIVAQRQEERWQYYMFDPTFNGVFRHRDTDQYATVDEMLDLIMAGDDSPIVVETQPFEQRDFLSLKSDKCLGYPILREGQDFLFCAGSTFGLEEYFTNFGEALTRSGYSPDLIGMVQLLKNRIFHVGSSLDASARQELLSRIEARRIPYGND